MLFEINSSAMKIISLQLDLANITTASGVNELAKQTQETMEQAWVFIALAVLCPNDEREKYSSTLSICTRCTPPELGGGIE